ncbi:hypothetical protein A3D84_03045 [Candidatus Woesebacteria bacterium RIFCSPHIGHO2_02_FULL_42_20]|uniref:Uncharacterized protein n=1 Tax=Candidatus Woesebacteria bacterium RIFCSPHIGHO2_12_FULL_41_24 TaxID=1802510 RepID=A0A1F8ARQ3_9BACT|nr:MAG: hypothetical protein A2W15_03235 [Candidatus Woesebacteria bacterium RBG_16_41_13]OGM30554.1 MAG: hypothetical protein A2873_05545 [Candidatus Woesebacteria bacterium RIFCSPHIGHO2_01_FULL_42_80]OGM34818.1 MAG: hypothetical protein A3D84_03045 [Candidatus Woesebacteria bacterium RIFCSPHIGHO2_02_FULL_42_20]OGM54447.1 MAG: hypothetical protein A3E44_00080 [Candidatus Woesebacteria bacterium RIFCSPHIGHO2_12_FULL_41_24]OGM66414.1 MAG: hypothetical protein A2969_00875 [Candidatus Woesebacteri
MKKSARQLSFDDLRERLKLKKLTEQATFSKNFPAATKFFKNRNTDLGKIRDHSIKLIGSGLVTGSILLTHLQGIDEVLPSPQSVIEKLNSQIASTSKASQKLLLESLKELLPSKVGPLSREQEKALERVFEKTLNIPVRATLEGEHLNTVYGYVGAEQHLKRYPGDFLSQHSGDPAILRSGIAPGLGAWGYFAQSKAQLSEDLIEKEKWYTVVQTLYLPEWNRRVGYLRDWYRYRKVLIVNTKNGNAVVASIADSGPAAWTGKHYGGSPEVMEYLGGSRYKKGPVLVFFVDDPDNNVPLGPVEYNKYSAQIHPYTS